MSFRHCHICKVDCFFYSGDPWKSNQKKARMKNFWFSKSLWESNPVYQPLYYFIIIFSLFSAFFYSTSVHVFIMFSSLFYFPFYLFFLTSCDALSVFQCKGIYFEYIKIFTHLFPIIQLLT